MLELDPATPNVVPDRYRTVAVTDRAPSLDEGALRTHFVGREVYHRTRFLVLRHGGETALAEVSVIPGDDLFLVVDDLRLLVGADRCLSVVDPELDVGVPSALASAVPVGADVGAVVVEGRYGHISFLLNPAPLHVEVLDVADPEPAKLIDQVQRVLSVAEDLPPVRIRARAIDVLEVLAADTSPLPEHVLIPCRGSGLELDGTTLHFLDERPDQAPWTLLGCERSQRIHRWFYDEPAELVDVCPRRFHPVAPAGSVLSRCCMLQEGIGERAGVMEVPWGASLVEVREAIERLIEAAQASGSFSWHRT